MWAQLGGSLAAVLALFAIAWWLKLGGAPAIADEGEAMRLAEDALSGFEADQAWLSLEGHHAVVTGRDGSLALIRPHGARFIVRRAVRPEFRQLDQLPFGGRVEIDTGEARPFTLHLDNRWSAGAFTQALVAAAARVSPSLR